MIGHGNGFALMNGLTLLLWERVRTKVQIFSPIICLPLRQDIVRRPFSLASLRAFPEMRSTTFVFAVNYHLSGVD